MKEELWPKGLLLLTLGAMLAALYAIFVYVPTEKEMGIAQRIFYFHVPIAWLALLAFTVVFAASILYLWQRQRRWDMLAACAAEIGVFFCTLTLITGSLWAKVAWGAWWTWDPRLTTALVLWLIYVSYLMLRAYTADDARQGAFAAVVGIVGYIDVPIVFMSIRWWRSIHPVLFQGQEMSLAPSMLLTLLVSVVALTLLFALLLLHRFRLAEMEQEVEELRWALEEGEAQREGLRSKDTVP